MSVPIGIFERKGAIVWAVFLLAVVHHRLNRLLAHGDSFLSTGSRYASTTAEFPLASPENSSSSKRVASRTVESKRGDSNLRYGFNRKVDPSPYELRRPDKSLPDWAKKARDRASAAVPKEKQLCFVHCGKTGGSSIGCSLGFQLHCDFNDHRVQHSVLAASTTHTVHSNINDCPQDTQNYLISVRNPLDRLLSVFVYERPSVEDGFFTNKEQNRLQIYRECGFRTLNELAEQGLAPEGTASPVCKKRASEYVQGLQRFGYHAFFNYQYYLKELRLAESAKLFVIRNEHMVDDWNRIESILGGTQVVQKLSHVNSSDGKRLEGDRILSERARHLLCEALRDEIQAYKTILHQAVNLNKQDVQSSLQDLQASFFLEG